MRLMVQRGDRAAALSAVCRPLLALTLALVAGQAACQSLHYVEPGLASCPAAPVRSAAAAKTVQRGAAVSGSITVACGFTNGSYTVSLNSTDAGATFSPKTFIVNFGRIVGSGGFAVRFSTLGEQSVSATITSNMGSPAVPGHFASAADRFNVVQP